MKRDPHFSNRLVGILFVVFATALLACGGGGSPGGGSTTGDCPDPVGTVVSVRLEAVQEGTSTVVDATNIFLNEAIRFRITGIDTGATGSPRINLCATGFTLSGSPGGTLSTDGAYVAPATASTSTGVIRVTYAGTTYTLSVRVVAPEAVIAGRIRLSTGSDAPRIGVKALNSSGSVVASGFSGADGSIRMSTPTTAVKFTLDFNDVDPAATYYVRQFTYNNKSYSTVISGCVAPLPTLTAGSTTSLLSNVLVFQASGSNPPPPPDGCQ
jgi:hypothetical protein